MASTHPTFLSTSALCLSFRGVQTKSVSSSVPSASHPIRHNRSAKSSFIHPRGSPFQKRPKAPVLHNSWRDQQSCERAHNRDISSRLIIPSDGYPGGSSSSDHGALRPLRKTLQQSFSKAVNELSNVTEYGSPSFSNIRHFITLVLYLKWCNVPSFQIIDSILLVSSERIEIVQPLIHHIYGLDAFCLTRDYATQRGYLRGGGGGRSSNFNFRRRVQLSARGPKHTFSLSEIKRYSAMYASVADDRVSTVSWSLQYFNQLVKSSLSSTKKEQERRSEAAENATSSTALHKRSALPRVWEELVAYIVLSSRRMLNS